MKQLEFCIPGVAPAILHAKNTLDSWGFVTTREPGDTTTHLLLPVPTPTADEASEELVAKLPKEVTILGGNIRFPGRKWIDFLLDEYYLAENAAITAHCALKLAMSKLEYTLTGKEVLIIGWGRIGKCLAELLRSIGANVTVAVRRESDCAMLEALGYTSVLMPLLRPERYHILFNTAPAPLFSQDAANKKALLIDLASRQGISGDRVIWARGLPGKMAPETSGALIAKTSLRYALERSLV